MTRARTAGFTIVELLMAIGILALLMGIVTTVASGAIRQSREQKTKALKDVLQNGLATYRAQNDEWPGKLKAWATDGLPDATRRADALDSDDYDKVLEELVKSSVKADAVPLMDMTGFPVAPRSALGKGAQKVPSQTFSEAVKKNKKRGTTYRVSQLAFGYLTADGRFCRFLLLYNADTDSVTVMTRWDYETWWKTVYAGDSGKANKVEWPKGYE